MTPIKSNTDLSPINELRDQLLSRLPDMIHRIVVYGSHARGEAEKDSDVDLLVVVDEYSPSIVEKVRAARYEVMQQHQYQPLLSLLLISERDWGRLSKHSAGLKYNIEREGITLWSRN